MDRLILSYDIGGKDASISGGGEEDEDGSQPSNASFVDNGIIEASADIEGGDGVHQQVLTFPCFYKMGYISNITGT